MRQGSDRNEVVSTRPPVVVWQRGIKHRSSCYASTRDIEPGRNKDQNKCPQADHCRLKLFMVKSFSKAFHVEMRLLIKPMSEFEHRLFTSSDVVTGFIYLDIHNSLSISEIEFSIKGKFRAT